MSGTSTNKVSVSQALAVVQEHLDSHQFSTALSVCQDILRIFPDNFEANHASGLCCYFLSDFEKSVEYYSKAVALDPNSFKLFLNISNLYQELGDFKEAVNALDRCIQIKPQSAIAFSNMANALNRMGCAPSLIIDHFKMAVHIDQGYAEAYMNLASYLTKLGRTDEAYNVICRGAACCPEHPGILALYAMYCGEKKMLNESKATYKKLESIQPKSSVAIVRLLSFAKKVCDWDEEARYKEKFLDVFSEAFSDQVKIATVNNFINHIGPFELLSVDLGLDKLKRVTELFSLNRQRSGMKKDFFHPVVGNKIKIGYVSADFNAHAVGLLVRNLFQFHDRSQFDITAYYLRGRDYCDEVTWEISSSCDQFKFCGDMHYADIATVINDDGIQILVDLSGYTEGAKPQIFDMKPSPIQCQFLGYPGTLGSQMIDYYITTQTYTPVAVAEHFTEKMVYLPEVGIATRSFDYTGELPTRSEIGLPANKFIFYCFSGFYRISKNTFDAWLSVLKKAENTVLWLFRDDPSGERRLLQYAEAQGVSADRFVFSERERITDRGIHRLADCLLDTIALPSGTAAIISLSDSVPIVSMAGDTPQTRTCLSQMAGVGLERLVANNIPDFIQLATKMATNKKYYQQQKDHLNANLASAPLFDQGRFVKHLENAYQQMISINLEDLGPKQISVRSISASAAL